MRKPSDRDARPHARRRAAPRAATPRGSAGAGSTTPSVREEDAAAVTSGDRRPAISRGERRPAAARRPSRPASRCHAICAARPSAGRPRSRSAAAPCGDSRRRRRSPPRGPRDPGRIELAALEREVEEGVARPRLGLRREHPGGGARRFRPGLGALEHRHAAAAARRARRASAQPITPPPTTRTSAPFRAHRDSRRGRRIRCRPRNTSWREPPDGHGRAVAERAADERSRDRAQAGTPRKRAPQQAHDALPQELRARRPRRRPPRSPPRGRGPTAAWP